MARNGRHVKILEIIAEKPIETQDELASALVAEGFNVTQATVSRDIKELGLIKINDGGRQRYVREGGKEKAAAGLTVAESDIAFTVRFCKQAAEVTADGFRILFQGEIYNIVAVDHMNYKKKALKFRCEKARR